MNDTQRFLQEEFNPHGLDPPIQIRKFLRQNLAKIFAKLQFTKGAEVGVADGRFSEGLCQRIPGLTLLCVDTWTKYRDNPRGGGQDQQDRNYQLAQDRLAKYDTRLVKAFSMEAVRQVPEGSLDFVYLDANHSFDYIMEDLIAWSRRVRPGGIVAGHDYYNFKWAGVCDAVQAYTRAHEIMNWFVTEEREPSFFWGKP